jgi:hypothetical protein
MEDLRYPIGKFSQKEEYTKSDLDGYIEQIEALPSRLEDKVKNLSDAQLDTPYREGGWTVRQVIHHLADSHMSAYIRVKWTITENSPVIKAYNEKLWAETPETKLDIAISLDLIRALHKKWASLLKVLSKEDFKKHFVHPETKRQIRIDTQTGIYAWHGEHHLAHINELKKRMGW